MDGKQYPRRRRPAASPCTTCGETHPVGTRTCPWDLFAQGRGPRPEPSQPSHEHQAPDATVGASVRPEPEAAQPKPPVQQQESVEHGESNVTDFPVEGDLTEAVERAEGLRAQIADLVQLVNHIQAAVTSRRSPGASEPSAARARELAS